MIKRLFALSFLSILMIISALGINYLFKENSFPIKQIMMVNKLNELDAGHLQQLISEHMNGGFFSLNIEQLRQEIETIAWIESVSVRKVWPETVYINIKEKKVSARWLASDQSKYTINKLKQLQWNKQHLISDKGVVFNTGLTKKQQRKFEQLAIYSTPINLSVEGLKYCNKIKQNLKQVSLKVLRCFQDQRRSWYVALDNGFELYLGQQNKRDNIIKRTELFIAAYRQIFKKYEKKIKRIDLRYSNGFAIKWNLNEEKAASQQTLKTG